MRRITIRYISTTLDTAMEEAIPTAISVRAKGANEIFPGLGSFPIFGQQYEYYGGAEVCYVV